MNGIEEAIGKMVQDATADLRERIGALEALADRLRLAAEATDPIVIHPPAPAPKAAQTANGNGPHHWSAALRRAAALRMKKRNSDPAFRKAQAKGTARRWREYRAQHNGSST